MKPCSVSSISKTQNFLSCLRPFKNTSVTKIQISISTDFSSKVILATSIDLKKSAIQLKKLKHRQEHSESRLLLKIHKLSTICSLPSPTPASFHIRTSTKNGKSCLLKIIRMTSYWNFWTCTSRWPTKKLRWARSRKNRRSASRVSTISYVDRF